MTKWDKSAMPMRGQLGVGSNSAHDQLDADESARGHFGAASVTET